MSTKNNTFTVYTVARGRLNVLTAIKETPTSYRIESGELVPKLSSISDNFWRRAGKSARKVIATTDKQEAIDLVREQIKEHRAYLDEVMAEAVALEASWDAQVKGLL